MFNSHSCCRSGLQLSAFSAFGGRSGYFVHFRPKLLSQTKTPLFCSLEAQFLFPLTLLYSNGTTERPPARSLGYSLSPYHRAGTHSLTDRHSASDRHAVPHPERVDMWVVGSQSVTTTLLAGSTWPARLPYSHESGYGGYLRTKVNIE